jgi:hypothetical protein
MAAVAKPFGLAPVRTSDSNNFNQAGTRYYIPSSDGSAYYIGDTVISAAGADANGVPQIAKAIGTSTVRGVIVGFEPAQVGNVSLVGASLTLENTAIPATKTQAYYAYVIDDSGIVFIAQDDGITTGNLIAANANKNTSLTITAGATLQSASGTVILSSSIATTQALSWRLIGLAQTLNQGQTNAFGGYGLWLLKANQHELAGNTAGI